MHRGHGHDGDMMQGEGSSMMGGGEMMMGEGSMMMEGDCHEMMNKGGMMIGYNKQLDEESLGQCPMSTIHKLLNHRDEITRHVKDSPKGVHTKTFSSSPETNSWIRQHVNSMMELVRSGHRIRNCDGLFKTLFDHASDMDLQCHEDDESGGVQCKFLAEGECAIGLAQAHAQVVSAFLANGWDEVHQDHEDMVPDSCFETSN